METILNAGCPMADGDAKILYSQKAARTAFFLLGSAVCNAIGGREKCFGNEQESTFMPKEGDGKPPDRNGCPLPKTCS